jgi:hypothetical protein
VADRTVDTNCRLSNEELARRAAAPRSDFVDARALLDSLDEFTEALELEVERRSYRLKRESDPYAIGANAFRAGARWAELRHHG